LHSLLDYQKVKQNTNYRNPVSGKEILVCVAETIRDNVLTKIKKSPFIGISVDESTDVTNDAQLSLCIQYTVYDEVKNEFIKLFNIKKRDAETIFQVLLKFLKENIRYL